MLVGFIPGDREKMVQCLSRRRQGTSARGGDGEVVRTGIEPRESTVMAGVTTVKVMRWLKEMGDKGSVQVFKEKRSLFWREQTFQNPTEPCGQRRDGASTFRSPREDSLNVLLASPHSSTPQPVLRGAAGKQSRLKSW